MKTTKYGYSSWYSDSKCFLSVTLLTALSVFGEQTYNHVVIGIAIGFTVSLLPWTIKLCIAIVMQSSSSYTVYQCFRIA